MINYDFNKDANLGRLKTEIQALGIPGFLYCSSLGTNLSIFFEEEISEAQLNTLSAAVLAHVKVNSQEYVNGIIMSAADYGMQIIKDWGTRNVLLGKTDAQIDSILENPDALKIGMGLMSGSLKYARRKIQQIAIFDGVTQDDKDFLIAKLNAFLGPE